MTYTLHSCGMELIFNKKMTTPHHNYAFLFRKINFIYSPAKTSQMKTNILSIASLVIGIIGLTVFFQPALEIICGIGGLVLAIMGKTPDESKLIYGIRSCGHSFAIINIGWVCLEFALKFLGFNLF